MRVDDVKAMPQSHVDAQGETAGGKIGVLAHVAQEGLESEPLSCQRRLPFYGHFLKHFHFCNPVDMNSVNILRAFLAFSSHANHRNGVAVFTEELTFIPHPWVVRVMVFDQHQYLTSRFHHKRQAVSTYQKKYVPDQ